MKKQKRGEKVLSSQIHYITKDLSSYQLSEKTFSFVRIFSRGRLRSISLTLFKLASLSALPSAQKPFSKTKGFF